MKLFKKSKENDIVWRKANKDDTETVKKLRHAIKSNDISEVKNMIRKDKQLVRLTTVFGTFLHDAANVGNIDIVKILLKGDADVNKNETLLECRPLAIAAENGHLDIVKYLIKNGAVFDCTDILRNPIFKAINGGHLDIVKYLVESDIDLSIVYDTESFGKINAYNYAKSYRKDEIYEYLEKVYYEKNIELNIQERNPWVCTVDDDFTGEEFTSKRMEILEHELGIFIPKYYKEFLLENFPKEMFFAEALDNDEWTWLGEDAGLFHTLRSFIAYNSIEPDEEKKRLIHEGYLAIGTNGGGDFFCIKLGTEEDKVYLYENESDEYKDLGRTIDDHSRWLIENEWGNN